MKNITPFLMGNGKPLFKDGERPLPLKFSGAEDFGNGVTLLRSRN